ncbi:heme peroxidase [Pavlovales sp. CCMP2436]|nr:heme peroxidase [Pavlovales sp. CCMP2436]
MPRRHDSQIPAGLSRLRLGTLLLLGGAGWSSGLHAPRADLPRAAFIRGCSGALAATLALRPPPPTVAAATATDDLRAEARLRAQVRALVLEQPALAGAFVRLAFHDSAPRDRPGVGGPNGSIIFELDRPANLRLSVPLGHLARLRAADDSTARLTLADSIAVAGAEAVEAIGGPHIWLPLGRRDATGPDSAELARPLAARDSRDRVTTTLPDAGLSSVGLRRYFARLGLSERELVALSGAHGFGRHPSLIGMPAECLKKLTPACLEAAPSRPPFLTKSADNFNNDYFKLLLRWNTRDLERGAAFFLPTDVALVIDPGLRRWVSLFARDEVEFSRAFSSAYVKLCKPVARSGLI